jgi:capsular exopolysaccharide synthesis family protein
MLSLQEEINKTKPNILDNISSQRTNIRSAMAALQKDNEHYNSMLQAVPKKERQLVEVSRQHTIKSDIYSFLLQKREETAYSITSILPDCYMVSNPTTSERPVSPKKPFLAILALVVALGIPYGWLYAKDNLNGKILYRNDIERLTPFPIIGEVIFEKLKSQIVIEKGQRSFAIEQFRLIRTALKHQGSPPGSCKRILISSCIKGDGKSFVSVNLAVSMARSGKRVALLEMDLHQPKISDIFEIPKCEGITDYLNGKVDEESILIPEAKYPGLFVIPTGYLTEDANELLNNGRLDNLLNYLANHFDYIIIDTAPLVASTDGYIIAPYCDLLLAIVRHNHTPKSFVELINKEMAAHNIKDVAIIFNGVKKRGVGKYSYGYGHGYGYDNRFSYEEYGKKKKY